MEKKKPNTIRVAYYRGYKKTADDNLKSLLPKDEHDIQAVEKWNRFAIDGIKPTVPDLLVWLQDLNWPVAQPIALFLLNFIDEITNEILKILQTDDEVWKYNLIHVFGENINDAKLKKEIIRLAKFPTDSEKSEEIDLISKKIIQKWNTEK